MTVLQWEQIRDRFTDSLLVGNGGSISVHQPFRYGSLLQEARDKGLISGELQSLFDKFDIEDFEMLLRRLHYARLINQTFEIDSSPISDAYNLLRNGLIQAVRSVHCSKQEIEEQLLPLGQYMSRFKTVFSLNYDLIVYWATLAHNDASQSHKFKDCFTQTRYFTDDWRDWRRTISETSNTLVFYPHGGLQFVVDQNGDAMKITRGARDLLDEAFTAWEHFPPLIVCDGQAADKQRAMRQNDYLSQVLESVLPTCGPTLTCYGWGFGQQEEHILQAISKSRKYSSIAVSVHDPESAQAAAFMHRVAASLREHQVVEVLFFDAASEGCWTKTPIS